MRAICNVCREKDSCSYLKRGREGDCIDVQTSDYGYEEAVEKACEVYRKELTSIVDIFNRFGKELYNINELGEIIHIEGCVKDFHKAIGDNA